jgi:FKBP-type peptidyl-prolyl cis-trans isomerase 2
MVDFIKISYTARVKDGGVFDTTREDIAKKEGIYDEKRKYMPLTVLVGEGHVIKGLDEALEGMKVSGEKKVEIPPEKGYGGRNPDLVRLVPLRRFKEQKIKPIPGMPLEIDCKIARIQTVAGGRVRVDFNPELAGKTLVFDVRVEEKAKTKVDRIKFLLDRSFNDSSNFGIKETGKSLAIDVPENAYKDRNALARKASFTAETFKYLDFSKVIFNEIWGKKKQ